MIAISSKGSGNEANCNNGSSSVEENSFGVMEASKAKAQHGEMNSRVG